MKCLLSIPSLHTHFLLSFLKNPVLLGVFDVHHKHSEAWEGRGGKKKPLEYTKTKLLNLLSFGLISTWKQKYVAVNIHWTNISKLPSYLYQYISFGKPLLSALLLSPCDSNGASGIQDWPITVHPRTNMTQINMFSKSWDSWAIRKMPVLCTTVGWRWWDIGKELPLIIISNTESPPKKFTTQLRQWLWGCVFVSAKNESWPFCNLYTFRSNLTLLIKITLDIKISS